MMKIAIVLCFILFAGIANCTHSQDELNNFKNTTNNRLNRIERRLGKIYVLAILWCKNILRQRQDEEKAYLKTTQDDYNRFVISMFTDPSVLPSKFEGVDSKECDDKLATDLTNKMESAYRNIQQCYDDYSTTTILPIDQMEKDKKEDLEKLNVLKEELNQCPIIGDDVTSDQVYECINSVAQKVNATETRIPSIKESLHDDSVAVLDLPSVTESSSLHLCFKRVDQEKRNEISSIVNEAKECINRINGMGK